jgi:seryl-tRNA synthetase
MDAYETVVYEIADRKDLRYFSSAEEYEQTLKDSRTTLGLTENYEHSPELLKAIRNTRTRIKNRISARASRKRKVQERENLQEENKRLRRKVEELEDKIEELEIGCCMLCILRKELGDCMV